MNYFELRQKNLPIWSGVVEVACKNLIGARMKKSGALDYLMEGRLRWPGNLSSEAIVGNNFGPISFGSIFPTFRRNIGRTPVATQLPVENWHDNIRDPTIADAILDSLIHSAHMINLKGESMRKLHSSLTNKANSEK